VLHAARSDRSGAEARDNESAYVRTKQLSRGRDEIHVRVRKWEVDMLWTVLVALLILWLLGFSLHIGGGLIHLLLVVGLVVLVINLLSGRRTAS
jgi:hypothetical protein